MVAGAGTAGVAGRAAFFSGFAAAFGFVLALAETQPLTYALCLSPFSPFFSAAALQALVLSCCGVAARAGVTISARPSTAMIVFMISFRWIRWIERILVTLELLHYLCSLPRLTPYPLTPAPGKSPARREIGAVE